MLVPCSFRGDHKIRQGHMHGPSQCPPPAGERGDHRRLKRLAARFRAKQADGMLDKRGEAVAGVGGNQAKSHRQGKKKAVTKGLNSR